MEHVVQFAIGIDDERIKKPAEEYASKKVVDDIEKDIRDGNQEKGVMGYMESLIFLEKRKSTAL